MNPASSIPSDTLLRESHRDDAYREVDSLIDHSIISTASNMKDSRTRTEGFHEHQPSTKLFRSWMVLVLVISYAALAIFAWTVTCILSFRPIVGEKQYGFVYDPEAYDTLYVPGVQQAFVRNESWYRAARVIQSIVGVLTIPLTSAVFSSAAVIYVQRHRRTPGLTMRQLMALADRGWIGPSTLGRAITGWKRHGTSLLLVAILVTILGGIISPLQQIFLSTKTIKTRVKAGQVEFLVDISDQFNSIKDDPYNLVTIITRNSLLSANNVQPQSQLWQGGGRSCNLTDISAACASGNTLGNIASLEESFLAQLPSGFSTGLIRQYAPRFNSSARYENISAAEWPVGCNTLPGALYVEYSYTDGDTSDPGVWNVQVCMPGNVVQSPWTLTRDRQDFTEELYLNITIFGGISQVSTPHDGNLYRITSNTTAGYFELPNYMNNQIAGPLLDKIPAGICGADTNCIPEGATTSPNGTVYDIFGPDDSSSANAKRDVGNYAYNTTASNGTFAAESVLNKGPLLVVALALFGSDSFLATRVAHPEAYIGLNRSTAVQTLGNCIDLYPMGFLLDDSHGARASQLGRECIGNTDYGEIGQDLGEVTAGWLSNFIIHGDDNSDRLSNAFTAAVFLANEAWISEVELGSLTVNFDYGADTLIPTISKAGIIIVSILLATFLISLFITALYASFSPRWTNQLDAFAMMKIGAAMSDKISLTVSTRKSQTSVLDTTPGWIGDASEEHEEVGRLGLGAKKRLDSRRDYLADTWRE